MIKKFEQYNESLRDKMTPIDIRKTNEYQRVVYTILDEDFHAFNIILKHTPSNKIYHPVWDIIFDDIIKNIDAPIEFKNTLKSFASCVSWYEHGGLLTDQRDASKRMEEYANILNKMLTDSIRQELKKLVEKYK